MSTKETKETTDLSFLREMKTRLELARNGDETEFDFVLQMIDDWIDELESFVNKRLA